MYLKLWCKYKLEKGYQQVYVTYGNTLVVIPINSKNAYVNGNDTPMDIETKIKNNKTMISLRFAANSLNFKTE